MAEYRKYTATQVISLQVRRGGYAMLNSRRSLADYFLDQRPCMPISRLAAGRAERRIPDLLQVVRVTRNFGKGNKNHVCTEGQIHLMTARQAPLPCSQKCPKNPGNLRGHNAGNAGCYWRIGYFAELMLHHGGVPGPVVWHGRRDGRRRGGVGHALSCGVRWGWMTCSSWEKIFGLPAMTLPVAR